MKRAALLHLLLFLAVILAFTHASYAQLVAGPGVTDASSSQPVSNRTFSFSGTIPGQLDGALSVTFSIYPDQQSATAIWTETQVIQVAGEKYAVLLGSTSATGLPPDIFSANQAHWLGVQVNGSEKRFLLVSVPYAMKAVEAERLGGLLPSDYVTVQQLQSALQSAVAPGTPTQPKATSTGPTGQAAAAGTPPQSATDFTDNNTSEVLLVTQQGPGYAIHAISNLQPAIYAENNALSGTALQVVETSTDGGASTGLFAQTFGSGSIAGVFDSAGPAILELRKSGTRMVFFDQFGDMTANGEVRASDFAGSGSGLTNIPNSATSATPSNLSNSIVARDFNGGFSAGTIQASSFVGSGFGLTDIPPTAINATALTISNSIVARDSTGSFNANQIFANTFFGSGTGLFNIPPTAINATPLTINNSIVARDSTGSFNANQIFANTFFGSGAGLFNIPPTAINATPLTINNSIVARDSTGSFNANQIFANTFFGSGAGLFNIPPIAINATSINVANAVVARDADGGFSAGPINASSVTASGAFGGSSANFSGAATLANSVLAVNDNGAQGFSFSVNSANNAAALFTSGGPTVLMAGRITGATTVLSSNGDLTLNGTATAHAFSGDGSALTNVSATKIGTLAPADIATNAALSAEIAARQNADTAIQSSVASETGARQSADTTLQNNISAEAAARASADNSLQASINSASAASAQLAAANTFTAKQTLAASTTISASLNVPAGTAPSSPAAGDVWNTGSTLQYRDNASTTRSLVSTTQSGGLQLLKLTASISPANVGSQGCTEQSFTVSGISAGDVLLGVSQPSTSSPGTNIAIGGFRVSAANTVAVQFCNVNRNNSTPTAGVYTFAFMR